MNGWIECTTVRSDMQMEIRAVTFLNCLKRRSIINACYVIHLTLSYLLSKGQSDEKLTFDG